MPKLRDTPQQQREAAFRSAVAGHAEALELNRNVDVAAFLDIPRQTYEGYKKGSFQKMPFEKAAAMGRKLKMTGREWCAAAGIPYEDASTV